LPSLEYRYTVRLRGSTTQRDRVSSSIGLSVDYSSIIARQGGFCQGIYQYQILLKILKTDELEEMPTLILLFTLLRDQ